MTISLPVGGAGISGGELPVTGRENVLAEFMETQRSAQNAPIRDAFTEAFAAGHIAYQDVVANVLAQTNPLYATGEYLRYKATERGIYSVPGEDDEVLRTRIFEIPAIVTPQAIVDAVNAIIAPYTTEECDVFEPEVDGLFIHDGTATAWDSFIGASPRYPDRMYYDDRDENDGLYLENNVPHGAIPSSGYRRSFFVRIPIISIADQLFTFLSTTPEHGTYLGDGSDTSGSESSGLIGFVLFPPFETADNLMKSIVGKIQLIKGQGMSWAAVEEAAS